MLVLGQVAHALGALVGVTFRMFRATIRGCAGLGTRVQVHLARGERNQTEHTLKQGRLARAVGTDQRNCLTGRDGYVDVGQRRRLSVGELPTGDGEPGIRFDSQCFTTCH